MTTGAFVDYFLPYMGDGRAIPAEDQARAILDDAEDHLDRAPAGVAITYSANYGQTRRIAAVYGTGGAVTGIGGMNQAAVMAALEAMLEGERERLAGRVRIAPVTTMNAYDDPVSPWTGEVHLGIVITDLDRIEGWLGAGWTVLGWQNQDTAGNSDAPYAVGGGVAASMDADVSRRIQSGLKGFAARYPA